MVCPICSKKFHSTAKLRRHMVVHTGEKAFACNLCSYKCNLEDNLRKHLMKTHKLDLPSRKLLLAKYVTLPKVDTDNAETVVVYEHNDNGEDVQIMADSRYEIKLQGKTHVIAIDNVTMDADVEGTSSPAPLEIDTNMEVAVSEASTIHIVSEPEKVHVNMSSEDHFEMAETTVISSDVIGEKDEEKLSADVTVTEVEPVAVVCNTFQTHESTEFVEYITGDTQEQIHEEGEDESAGKVLQLVTELDNYNDFDDEEQVTIHQIIQTLVQNSELAPGKSVPIHLGGDKVVDVMLAEDMQTVLIQKSHLTPVVTL